MRPDEHKSKESRKYQARKKFQGDHTATDIANARKKAAKTRDRGVGIASIIRRNAEPSEETEEEKEERKLKQARFSRRKVDSNADRYIEETEQEIFDKDIELGIDRETTDLVSMLENKEEGTSTFFKFKDERLFNNNDQGVSNRNMLQLDFTVFDSSLRAFGACDLLDLYAEDNPKLAYDMLNEHPIVLDRPIVPSFSKNAKGYVLFKSHQATKPNVLSETDGIYLRNDGSNHHVIANSNKPSVETKKAIKESDDLDELLAMDDRSKKVPASSFVIPKTVLSKPGSIHKQASPKSVAAIDDEAWLDDLLG